MALHDAMRDGLVQMSRPPIQQQPSQGLAPRPTQLLSPIPQSRDAQHLQLTPNHQNWAPNPNMEINQSQAANTIPLPTFAMVTEGFALQPRNNPHGFFSCTGHQPPQRNLAGMQITNLWQHMDPPQFGLHAYKQDAGPSNLKIPSAEHQTHHQACELGNNNIPSPEHSIFGETSAERNIRHVNGLVIKVTELQSCQGQWYIKNTPLSMFKWFEGFNPRSNKPSKVPTWVDFPDLPVEFYPWLEKLGATLGEVLGQKGHLIKHCPDLVSKEPEKDVTGEPDRNFQQVQKKNTI
ncbi:hypothetical protein L7F22_026511 [Adiantum nelumboides]|nr:hypothetical protein [Adiantum nelumboides]